MLLVLLLGVADFGRVFTAGITLEAAARNGAEAAAQEYVQLVRNNPGQTLTSTDYARLHSVAGATVCHEVEGLTGNYSFSGPCSRAGVATCIHDAAMADVCGSESSVAPADCTAMSGWSPGIQGGGSAGSVGPLPYVEVRVCYQFKTIIPVLRDLQLPFGWGLSLGDIWLQKGRQFTVACYPTPSGTGCG